MKAHPLSQLPSIEQLLQHAESRELLDTYGHQRVRNALRAATQAMRESVTSHGQSLPENPTTAIVASARHDISSQANSTLLPVFNLTGTVLHTNLGRSVLPDKAIEAVALAAREPVTIEFDLAGGHRGDRDVHIEALLCEITGAPAATVVNNNAAAVILCLNTLAASREVPVSRGELVEIGGSFRMPQIMASAGCELVEVGTTNRTHLQDYADAIGPKTGALMTVDPSNYAIQGFTASADKAQIAQLAHTHKLPLIDDLGSGTLVDLTQFGLPAERTVTQALAAGADLVTFSGDKLLGGPQAGIIVGRADLIERVRRNPMKRAMRLDKLRLAALRAVLQIYQTPEKLCEELPTLRLLTRDADQILQTAQRVLTPLREALDSHAQVEITECDSQIGSGALPANVLPSHALAIRMPDSEGISANQMAEAFRCLPRPVLGRINKDQLILDVRTLATDAEPAFIAQLANLPALIAAQRGKPVHAAAN